MTESVSTADTDPYGGSHGDDRLRLLSPAATPPSPWPAGDLVPMEEQDRSRRDRARVVAGYDALSVRQQSPVVELNRAVAVGFRGVPQALSLVRTAAERRFLQRRLTELTG